MTTQYAPNSWEGRAMKTVMAGFTDLPTIQERGPIILTHGEGARVFDVHGRSWLDANSGLWNMVAGFDHPGRPSGCAGSCLEWPLTVGCTRNGGGRAFLFHGPATAG